MALLAIILASAPLIAAAPTGNAVAPLTTLAIEASVPQYSKQATITIDGRTKPLASIQAFVNNVRIRAFATGRDGTFRLLLPLNAGANAIRLEANEGASVVKKEYTLTYDGTPPTVTLDKEIPAATQASSITVSGDVNEKVTIYYRAISRREHDAPAPVTGLKAAKIEANAIELSWDAATDFKEYLIERNGKRIATTSLTTFRDTSVQPGKSYSYSVSAADDSCNIGASADISVTTKTGGTNTTTPTPSANLSCEPPYQTANAGSPFSLVLALVAGDNDLDILFQDLAGNTYALRQTVRSDAAGPKFLETNLKEISPSYTPDIKIKGKLDEQGTVFVYLNDDKKPTAFGITERDGTFSIKVSLRTDIRIQKGGTQKAGIAAGEGWVNKIKLEAIDLAENRATFGPANVDFLLCGSGTWWNANIGEALPSMLLPRLMLQGVQQIGIPFNITYIGSVKTTAPPKVRVQPILLAPDAEDEYDHDWVSVTDYAGKRSPTSHVGYVQIQFENVNPLPDDSDATAQEKELALSAHRRGECVTPGVGCVKLFLQMDINFQESVEYRATDPKAPIVTPKIEPRTQRICMPIEVGIDQTIPADVIPDGMLRTALKGIDAALQLIDKVLKPLTTIGEYVLYGCLASNVWLYLDYFQEKLACEGSAISSAFTGSSWKPAVAEAGACEFAYSTDATKMQACKSCQDKIDSRKKFKHNVMQGLCDRIGCPSAPTFSSYIKGNIGTMEPLGDANKDIAKNHKNYFDKWAVGSSGTQGTSKQLFAGNDCGFTYKDFNFITPTYNARAGGPQSPPGGVGLEPAGGETYEQYVRRVSGGAGGKVGIREMYDIVQGNNPVTFNDGPTAEDCKAVLHPAHPNCCGTQYQKDWSSACGLGIVSGSLDTFDELEQSTCLSAKQANVEAEGITCNSLWNSVAGFCESHTGEATPQVVNAEASWTPAKTGADDNAVYMFIIPQGFREAAGSGLAPQSGLLGTSTNTILPSTSASAKTYQVWRGYAVKTPQFAQLKPEERQAAGVREQYRLSAGLTAALEKDVSHCFGQVAAVRAEGQQTRKTDTEQRSCLYQALCDGKMSQCEHRQIDIIYDKINDIVGVPDQQYIVRPNSGLFRSIQCVCLPAVTSYLTMWQKILGAFHNCFSTILLTGEGSEGFCAAKFSGTICDLFFEAISCITSKFSTPGVGGRAGTGGFGDILGALTSAGTAVTRDVNERYGQTNLYKSLFSERKLLHAVCTWAFTGTWDLNVQGLFQQEVETIPVETTAALTTCERTFISYDPTTQPTGLASWAYRIAGGMVAGADVQYRLKLKCSSGFNCDPRDYPDGKCDCTAQERSIYVSSAELRNGRAKKYDVVNFDAPFLISAQSAPDSDVRYDTAELEWSWTDPQTKTVRTDKAQCAIRETEGGNAPAFCAFDAFSARFRCLFGEVENGIRMMGGTPAYPEKQDAFGIGDSPAFTINIKQKFPEARRDQAAAKKFLVYDIRDGAGTTIVAPLSDSTTKAVKTSNDEVSQQYTLEVNGVYKYAVPQPVDSTPLSKFVLSEQIIKDHMRSGGAALPFQQYWPISTSGLVTAVKASTNVGLAATEPMWFSIHFPRFSAETKGEESFDVYRITPVAGKAPTPDPTLGWKNQRSATPVFSGKQATDRPLNSISFTLGQTAVMAGNAVTIEFKRIPSFNAKEIEILIAYIPQPVTQAAACDPSKPVTWNAVFTVYDADKHGNPTDQKSVDPETGREQVETVPFNVRCAKPDAIKTTAAPAAPAATTTATTPATTTAPAAGAPAGTTAPAASTTPAAASSLPTGSISGSTVTEAMLNPLSAGYTVVISGITGTDNKWQLHGDNHWVRIQTRTLSDTAFFAASPLTATAQELVADNQLNTWEFLGVTPINEPVAVTIIEPLAGQTFRAGEVTFSWEPVPGKAYAFELYTRGGTTPLTSFKLPQTTYIPTLRPGLYDWRVGTYTSAAPTPFWSARIPLNITA
jgi:hypothetical protein